MARFFRYDIDGKLEQRELDKTKKRLEDFKNITNKSKARRRLSNEQINYILTSTKTAKELAAELSVPVQSIYKARSGGYLIE